MSPFSFRPQLESLDGRVLPSANPTPSITDVSFDEGNSGQAAFVFTVSLSKASSKLVSVNYTTADAPMSLGRSPATSGSDYVPQAGKLTFAPGERTKTITVLANGDEDVAEGHERFAVNLSGANRARIADAQGIGTILNDDIPPGMAIEPNSGLPYVPAYPPPPDEGGCSPDGPYFCP